jgi:hypothetical protein
LIEPRGLFLFGEGLEDISSRLVREDKLYGKGLEDISSRLVREDKEFLAVKYRRIVALVVTVHAQPECLQR